jgi:hypothetical protein
MESFIELKQQLIAPKGQFNSFGKYKYRSAEDILEALKPLLAAHQLSLKLSDEMVAVGERYYIKATATIKGADGFEESATAYAREPETRKGMDDAQVTGATSSYARKYALNGLFCIDDNKDPDSTNKHNETVEVPDAIFAKIQAATTADELGTIYKANGKYHGSQEFIKALGARKQELKNGL